MRLMLDRVEGRAAWVVSDELGRVLLRSIALTRKQAIRWVTEHPPTWRQLYRLGWRCRQYALQPLA